MDGDGWCLQTASQLPCMRNRLLTDKTSGSALETLIRGAERGLAFKLKVPVQPGLWFFFSQLNLFNLLGRRRWKKQI